MLCDLVKVAVWNGFVGFLWVEAEVAEVAAAFAGNGRAWREWGGHEAWQARVWAVRRWSPKSWVAGKVRLVAVTAELSGRGAGEKKMRWQVVTRPWQLVGDCSEVRGWIVSGVRAAEGTGGEPEVAEQPLQLPAHWTPAQVVSNIGRSPCL